VTIIVRNVSASIINFNDSLLSLESLAKKTCFNFNFPILVKFSSLPSERHFARNEHDWKIIRIGRIVSRVEKWVPRRTRIQSAKLKQSASFSEIDLWILKTVWIVFLEINTYFFRKKIKNLKIKKNSSTLTKMHFFHWSIWT